jgi:hypothetical protein
MALPPQSAQPNLNAHQVNVQRGPSGKSKAPPLVAIWAERLLPHFSCSINPYRIGRAESK